MLPSVSVHYALTQQHFKPYLTRQIDKVSTVFSFIGRITDTVCIQTGSFPVKPVQSMLKCLSKHELMMWHFSSSSLSQDRWFLKCCAELESRASVFSPTKTHWNFKVAPNGVFSVTFTQSKYFTHHLRRCVPQSTGLNASQDMLIPAAAIWRHATCCLHSVTPNPTVPIALSSLPVSRWELCTPAATCACVCVCLCTLVRAHWGACCASIFTASVSDKPNESPENRYLPALSCSVLSSLFSHSVFYLLVFSLPALPTPPLTRPPHCLPKPTLLLSPWWVLPPSANKLPLSALGTHLIYSY